jgi:hypothetical protein
MKLSVIIACFFFSLSISCEQDNSPVGLEPGPPGSFSYQSYDTLGNLIVDGWIDFELTDSERIEGSWQLNNLSHREDIGPQYGSGRLNGTLTDSAISLNLNPQYADHNVYLDGIIKDNVIEGRWIWSTFIGPTNWGAFKAEKSKF